MLLAYLITFSDSPWFYLQREMIAQLQTQCVIPEMCINALAKFALLLAMKCIHLHDCSVGCVAAGTLSSSEILVYKQEVDPST